MSRRPEHELPADIYYGDDNARKYHVSSRVREIQRRMTERALELLQLPAGEQCLVLDLGAGTGLAGEVLQAAGHSWVGTDISRPMLKLAKQREFDAVRRFEDEDEDEAEQSNEDAADAPADGEEWHNPATLSRKTAKPFTYDTENIDGPQPVEVLQHDMGTCIPFRPGTFDGAISISALQWLCNIDRKGQVPQRRLKDLFQSLFNSLRRGARAVFQFYPENAHQTAMISTIATRCGFGGGVIVDFPHSTRARKYYLVIYAGLAPQGYQPPRPLGEEEMQGSESASEAEDDAEEGAEAEQQTQVKSYGKDKSHTRHRVEGRPNARPRAGTKEWILMKKEERRKHGGEARHDSRYSARKRPGGF